MLKPSSKGVWSNGIFIVRIFTAVMIIPHGMEIFDNKGMTDLSVFLSESHIPAAHILSYVAKISELLGGVLIAVGLFTKYITIPLIISMAVVIYVMGQGNIFNSDLAFLFLLLFLALFLSGPGKYSLDYYLFDRKK
jgi:putative oxidoreductase